MQEGPHPDTNATLTIFLTLTLTLIRILFTLMPTHLAFPTLPLPLTLALTPNLVQEGDDVVLECRRSLEVDHAHEQQRRFGRTKPRATSAGEDVAKLLPSRAFHILPLPLTLTLTLGEDVSRLLPSRAATFQARKTPLDKAMLAAKARVRTLTLTLAAKARARRKLTLNLTLTPTRTLTLTLKGARA